LLMHNRHNQVWYAVWRMALRQSSFHHAKSIGLLR
jgi:hypothetical protein